MMELKNTTVELKDITIADKALFDKYFALKQYEISDFTFTNLFMWRKSYNIKYSVINNYLCIFAQYQDHDPFVLYPVGNGPMIPVIETLIAYFKEQGRRLIIKSLTPSMAEELQSVMPKQFVFEPRRDTFDYVYKSSDLITLEGKKFHAKRNHINKFIANNEYTYLSLTPDLVQDCIFAANKWLLKHNGAESPGLEDENKAIIDALNHFEALKFKGGIIKVNGEVIAFTYGEKLTDHMAVIHVEKADPDIQGSYPMINQKFCEDQWCAVEFINREEDMGLEGLRKAKLSYNPVTLVEKYHAALTENNA